MHLRTIRTCLTAALLLLSATWAVTAEDQTQPKAASPKATTPKATTPKANAPKAAPAKGTKGDASAAAPRTKGKLKPVDINSASKNELSFMLGIPESLAAKIIAGRPYRTKANLLTHQVVTADVYARIKDKVMAKQ